MAVSWTCTTPGCDLSVDIQGLTAGAELDLLEELKGTHKEQCIAENMLHEGPFVRLRSPHTGQWHWVSGDGKFFGESDEIFEPPQRGYLPIYVRSTIPDRGAS